MEEWREAVGYSDYSVSSYGRVRRDTKARPTFAGRILRCKTDSRGYKQVKVSGNGVKARLVLVHRLIARAFLDGADHTMEINHKDGVKDNNAASNLEYCTRSENIRHAIACGLLVHKRGNEHWSHLHRELMPRGDRNGARTKPHCLARGERHGSKTKPWTILRGDSHPARKHPERCARGEGHGMSKLIKDDVVAIRALVELGIKRKWIAMLFDVGLSQVRRISRGESWNVQRQIA